MKQILSFLKEHWPLAVFGAAILALFLWIERFAELAYGSLRLVVVLLVAFAVIHLVFKSTLRPYIGSGEFAKDFAALNPSEKVFATVTLIIAITWFSLKCVVSP